jgi:hypothetical protein
MGNKACKPLVSHVVQDETTSEIIQWGVTVLRRLITSVATEEGKQTQSNNNKNNITDTLKKQALALARDQLGESVELFAQVDVPFTESFLESAFQQVLESSTDLSANPAWSETTPFSETAWFQRISGDTSPPSTLTKHDILMTKVWSFVRQRLSVDARNKVFPLLENRFIRSPAWVHNTDDTHHSVKTFTTDLITRVLRVLQTNGASRSVLLALTAVLALVCVDGLSPLRSMHVEQTQSTEQNSGSDSDEEGQFIAEFQDWYDFVRPLVEMVSDAYLHPGRWIRNQL